MDMQEPPAIYSPSEGSIKFAQQQPTFLIIYGQVRINLQDGSMEFEPNYSPREAAKVFWEAVSQDYRDMLRWKAEHERR